MDQTDHKIIRELQTNGRLTNQELAERVNLSPSPCLRRLKSLEKSGIIKGYCAIVDQKKYGMGKLHLCLFGDHGVELRDLLERDEQESELIERIQAQLQTKSVSHFLHDGNTGMTPHLASIGG